MVPKQQNSDRHGVFNMTMVPARALTAGYGLRLSVGAAFGAAPGQAAIQHCKLINHQDITIASCRAAPILACVHSMFGHRTRHDCAVSRWCITGARQGFETAVESPVQERWMVGDLGPAGHAPVTSDSAHIVADSSPFKGTFSAPGSGQRCLLRTVCLIVWHDGYASSPAALCGASVVSALPMNN